MTCLTESICPVNSTYTYFKLCDYIDNNYQYYPNQRGKISILAVIVLIVIFLLTVAILLSHKVIASNFSAHN